MRASKTISISMPPNQLKEMERVAKRENRPLSELVQELFRRYQQQENDRVLLERPGLRPYAERALSVLEILAKVAINVEPTGAVTKSRHESDNRFLECAEAAGAAFPRDRQY